MAKQSAVTSASPNPLATLTPSAAALHLVSSVDSSPLPPSTANPYTGVAAGAGAMVNPFATLGAVGENLAIPQPRGHSQTLSPLVAMLPQWPAAAPAMDGKAMSRQIPPLQLLSQQGISQDQWVAALQLVTIADTMGAANPAQLPGFGAIPCQGSGGGGHPDVQNRVDSARGRDRDHSRSPPAGYGCPSHLPGWDQRHSASPPRRHDRPVHDQYCSDSTGRQGDPRDAGGRRSNEYRKRSPPHWKRLSHSPLRTDHNLPSSGPKLVEWDYSIGPGNIKVLSRTLFVSGISSEARLRSLFNKFGVVQTCIVNIKKRHAFIKMISCQDAVSAREGVESFRSGEMQLRTRWGVGFGPRDCSDYQTGISVIPIERLTDADRKWLLTAEYGGTGGRPIQSGMVVEEPDIEIGAGLSSKAISQRIAAGTGGKRGRNSDCFGGGRGGHPDRNGFGLRRN
ncbi:Rpb7-binding protein seb1 [Penicillium subrubescens]|uniref:Rpb7-binding protein seb1 n=1 Tax=Penicillium subrubescens TaxID=1316194 RepID=A0A1Q5UQ66_9EURO|nr:Rpb7-binding protein seb1 [Penicillium subrubescens]